MKDSWRYNQAADWFVDAKHNYDPTDEIIDKIDGTWEEESIPHDGLLNDIQSLLTSQEYDIVMDIVIEKKTFRQIAKQMDCHHSWCHAIYKKAIDKLQTANIVISYLDLE